MKFNWGWGIFLFYTTFAVAMIAAVIKSFSFDNSLVVEDYYAQDIAYQQVIDQRSNSQSLQHPVKLTVEDGAYALVFPTKELNGLPKGQIQFYRPNSARFDRFTPLAADENGHFALLTNGLIPSYLEY
ncbi:MAG: FixH family protein [Bacteroidota bacterium]